MQKIIFITASILGCLSVVIGAFGAHALKNLLETNGKAEVFEIAVKYQLFHTLALLCIGILMYKVQHKLFNYSAMSMMAGIGIFSGSLYILSLTGVTWWGAITPIGGTFLIVGWILLLTGFLKTQ